MMGNPALAAVPYTHVPLASPLGAYAGFWRRATAGFVDVVLVSIAALVFACCIVTPLDPSFEPLYQSAVVALFIAYSAVLESSRAQATLGKRLLGLVVTDEFGHRLTFGRALGRAVGKLLASSLYGLGFYMLLASERRQALHDRIVRTLVTRRLAVAKGTVVA